MKTQTTWMAALVFSLSVFHFIPVAVADRGYAGPNEEEFLRRLPERPQMSDQEWARIAGEITEQRYIIQAGDTLWDICAKFMDSPFYWPKLWQVNSPHILNPHELTVGMELRFIAGSGTTLPSLGVSQEELKEKQFEELGFRDETIDVIPEAPRREDFDDLGFKKGLVVQKRITTRYRPEGFIVKELPPVYGEVVGSHHVRTHLTAPDITYVDLSGEAPVKAGDLLSIFKYDGDVQDPDSLLGFKLGRLARITAEVKVLDVVGTRARIEITRAYGEVNRGHFLTKLFPPEFDLKPRYLSQDLRADIVQLSDHDRTFDGQGGIVYLNRGESDGVTPGTIFRILATKDPLTDSDSFVRPEIKGELMVFKSEPFASTALIVKSGAEIYLGDIAIAARAP